MIGLLLCSSSCGPKNVVLPNTINTVAAGYPFALQVKNQMDRDAHLVAVIIDFNRQGGQFLVPQIAYGFASPHTNGRVFVIMVDNLKHEAFVALDGPNSPDNPYMPVSMSAQLDLSGVTRDISGILEIAKTNGLDEFCALATPKQGKVSCRLFTSGARPVWRVFGDGWDEKGPIADLAIRIDAQTGTVLSHTLQKATNRP